MNIGIIIGRYGDIDGVSLETSKWIAVLHKLGHKIFILSGSFSKYMKNEVYTTLLYPPLAFFSPECEWEQKKAFFYPDDVPDELLAHLERASEAVAIQILKWITTNKIDIILSQNASALPFHLSMGMGIKKAVEHTGIKTICHNHDFYWERGDRYKTPHKEVEKIIKSTFPLQLSHVRHAVINTYSKTYLSQKFNIDSTIVPNVMDFSKPYGKIDDYNKDMISTLELEKGDILLFQVTRIIRRKGIEVAIDLIDRMDNKKVKLVITGSYADDKRMGYYKQLVD